MTIYFAPDDTKPGDAIRYSDLEYKPSAYREHSLMVATIDAASYGDYDNSCAVERSNQRVMLADPEIAPHLVTITGSHGSSGLAYIVPDPAHPDDIHALPDALRDALSALADYPLLDDEDHSALESEMEQDAWQDWGRQDFVSALVKLLDEIEPDHEHDSDYLDAHPEIVDTNLWSVGCAAYNVNGGSGFEIESGGGVYFYVDEWIKRAGFAPDKAHMYADSEYVPTLAELAVRCRSTAE